MSTHILSFSRGPNEQYSRMHACVQVQRGLQVDEYRMDASLYGYVIALQQVIDARLNTKARPLSIDHYFHDPAQVTSFDWLKYMLLSCRTMS